MDGVALWLEQPRFIRRLRRTRRNNDRQIGGELRVEAQHLAHAVAKRGPSGHVEVTIVTDGHTAGHEQSVSDHSLMAAVVHADQRTVRVAG